MIRKFISYYRPHKKLFAADMFCAFSISVCTMFYPMITRNMVGRYIPDQNMRMLIFWSGVLLGLYILKCFFSYFVQYYGHLIGVRIQLAIRQDAFNHLQRLPFSFFDKTQTGTIMSRIINDTSEVSELAHHGPEDLFISFVMLVGSFILLCTINVPLTLIIFAFVPLLLLIAIKMRGQLKRAAMKTRVKIGEVNADLENAIAGIRVSRAYETSEHEKKKFLRGNKAYAHARGEYFRTMARFFSGTGLVMDILVIITLAAGAIFTYRGYVTIADLTAFILFTHLFVDPLRRLVFFSEQLQSGITGFARIQELMAQPTEEDSENAAELKKTRGEIAFENVTFRYNDGQNVLSDLSLHISPGEKVALVGPSGGGKSTLCHLIPRFYELDAGRITLDGTDIRQYTRLSLRRQIGIVQQDSYLFAGTIRDNIAYGDFTATDEQIRRAAQLANLDEFIQTLEHGYQTYVGERGVMLSGGQRQRVSIARIFLKNPPILILDEATSALDNTTEAQIQQSLDSLSVGRTVLAVAHRLSTIQNSDRIVVLTDKGVQEIGTHSQLLENQGLYYSLWNAQLTNLSCNDAQSGV